MLKQRKLALALLFAFLLLLIGALVVYSVSQERKEPGNGSRFVLCDRLEEREANVR